MKGDCDISVEGLKALANSQKEKIASYNVHAQEVLSS